MKKRGKKAQSVMGMPFATIFSIILIVVFIVVAFYVIKMWIGVKDCALIGNYADSLKKSVKSAYISEGIETDFKGVMPKKVEYACFVNFEKNFIGKYKEEIGSELEIFREIPLCSNEQCNLIFYPTAKACEMPGQFIENLNIDELTKENNPNCIKNYDGKIEFRLIKEYGDNFVKIKRVN